MPWENVGAAFAGTGEDICFTNQLQVIQRFFRVRATTP
jgi:hypothetical protein